MGLAERYEKAKLKLLSNDEICSENRAVFKEFFEYQEYKLKRQNGLIRLDDPCYKTLCYYVTRLKKVNSWFKNKPWKDLTREDIKRVYDQLEDGEILTKSGKPYVDKNSYYNKIFKSKPFRIVQKSELAKDIIEFSIPSKTVVRFVTEETFRAMVSFVSNPIHLVLFWLAWDIGENINALLNLKKSDFTRQYNSNSQEPEYLVHLNKSNLKRSRQPRSELTLYRETVQYLDLHLSSLNENEPLFNFEHRQALKIINSVSKRAQAKSQPVNEFVRWKDLRSGMACHLLRKGWLEHEVNARLGHVPGSKALAPYINYLALDRDKPKQRLNLNTVEKLQSELEEKEHKVKYNSQKLTKLEEENGTLREELNGVKNDMKVITELLERVIIKIPGLVNDQKSLSDIDHRSLCNLKMKI